MSRPAVKTAAWKLFHHKYRFRIPRAFLYGPEYLRKVGYHISGDPQIDRTAATELVAVNQTGAGITILHAQGAPLAFFDVRDTVPLFDDIQQHLRDWERVTYQGIHPDLAPPLEEFRQFEAVAMAIYSTAMHYQPELNNGSQFQDQLMAMNFRRNPEGTAAYLRSRILGDSGVLKPYESIVDRIEANMVED